jgi:3D (Asp-Asp-Asp) domain-containing protein
MMQKSILKLGITGLALSVSLLSGSAIATAKARIDSMQIAPYTFSSLKENKVLPKAESVILKTKSVEIKTPKTPPTVNRQATTTKPQVTTTKPQALMAKPQASKPKMNIAAASSSKTNKKTSIIQSTSNPKHTIEVSPGNSVSYSRLVTAKATAYTAAAEENGIWGAYDYYGDPLKLGTIAVDPNVIPMGSKVYVTGYRFDGLPAKGMIATATDKGSSVQGKRVDIFVPSSKADASKFGMQDVKVYIME